ncbi:hypothetical protein KQI52_06180 [bacterium]|nr:hypothetical protein [bacterium]
MRQIFIVAAVCLLMLAGSTQASEISVYGTFMNGGSVLNTATANSMMILDDGLLSLWTNPAGILSDRHQIFAGGSLQTAYSTQSQVSPANVKAGIGMIGYLYTFPTSAFALAFTPRNSVEASAEYNLSTTSYEIRNTFTYSEVTATYARKLGRGYSLGVSAGPILGQGKAGAITESNPQETLYSPLLWFARIGLKQKTGVMSWGLALETPSIGKFTIEEPTLVGYQRTKTDIDYSGALGVRAGVGWDMRFMGVEMDALYYNTDMIQVDGESANFDAPVLSVGAAAQMQVHELVRARMGLRVRVEDPNDRSFLQLGMGGSYTISEELLVYGSGGIMFPYGDGIKGTAYDDLLPFTLRAGVIYQNLLE